MVLIRGHPRVCGLFLLLRLVLVLEAALAQPHLLRPRDRSEGVSRHGPGSKTTLKYFWCGEKYLIPHLSTEQMSGLGLSQYTAWPRVWKSASMAVKPLAAVKSVLVMWLQSITIGS